MDEVLWGIAMMAWFTPAAVEVMTSRRRGPHLAARDDRQIDFIARVSVCVVTATVAALLAWPNWAYAQTATPAPQEQAPPVAGAAAPTDEGLGDLDAMTFACVRAGLNAAAREAARVPAQGTYQFAYFRIITDSHHSSYEVHFKSNYRGESDLKYCVSLYCQQGWDPKTTQASVSLMGNEREPKGVPAHGGACAKKQAPAKH
jgi:hypothetical protein